MTLYLKYRPQRIKDLDLDDVRTSLEKLIKSQNLPHAFLFSGPRGTGKTSAARILAKVVNCENNKKLGEPCNRCAHCKSITRGTNIDVIELDAASHRGIDDVRELKEAVKLAPANAKRKVYIIDEAHMLTTEASNALLKTLEEPPDHVLFVLATTNPEKLIETIRSRTTQIIFRKAKKEELVRSLKKVAVGEKMKLTKETLEIIADSSDGSFRDATKIIEQIKNEKIGVSHGKIEKFLGRRVGTSVDKLFHLLSERNTKKSLYEIERAVSEGIEVTSLITSMLDSVRISLLFRSGIGEEDNLDYFEKNELLLLADNLIKAGSDTTISYIEQLPFEVMVIRWCEGVEGEEVFGDSKESRKEEEIKIVKNSKTHDKTSAAEATKKKESIDKNNKPIKANLERMTEDIWNKILVAVKPINASIEALLRAARPVDYDGNTLKLGVYYRFHKERLEEQRNRILLEDVVTSVLSVPTRIVCILAEPPKKEAIKINSKKSTVLTESDDKNIVKVAKDIFGQ